MQERETPIIQHASEQIHTGTIISYVILAPNEERMAIIVVGTKLKQQHPNTARVIISGVAVLDLEEPFIFSIALIARGVAAFDMPSILALIHAVISSVAMFSLNDFGKMRFKIGRNSLDSPLTTPACFNTDIIPFQKAIMPTR